MKKQPKNNTKLRPNKKEEPLAEELGDLLQNVIVEEATQAVWSKFEAALQQLDQESLDLLEQHLDGTPNDKLGKENNLTEKQAEEFVSQVKRDLIRHLRKNCSVKH